MILLFKTFRLVCVGCNEHVKLNIFIWDVCYQIEKLNSSPCVQRSAFLLGIEIKFLCVLLFYKPCASKCMVHLQQRKSVM